MGTLQLDTFQENMQSEFYTKPIPIIDYWWANHNSRIQIMRRNDFNQQSNHQFTPVSHKNVNPTQISLERQSARMSKITNGLTRSGTGCFIVEPIWQQWALKGYIILLTSIIKHRVQIKTAPLNKML